MLKRKWNFAPTIQPKFSSKFSYFFFQLTSLSLKRLVEIFALNELFHQQFPEKEEPEYPNPDAKEGIELVKSTIVQFSGKSYVPKTINYP